MSTPGRSHRHKKQHTDEPVQSRPQGGSLVVAALCFVLALVILYPEPLLRGYVFQSADARNADAFLAVGEDALRQGQYPLWNPYIFGGMPTFGSLAFTKYLYPPGVISHFLQGTLGLPPLTWMLLHLLGGAVGMAYLLSRWRLPTAALVLGGLVWLAFPKVVAWGVHGHGSKLVAAMYLPWLVACGWNLMHGGGRKTVAALALLLGLQILRGHIQITYYSLLLLLWLGLWYGLRSFSPPDARPAARIRWQRTALIAASIALGFAIGSALLLPVREYASMSIRGTGAGGGAAYDYATGWSLAPAELVTLIFPAAAGFGKGTYLGLMPFTDYPNYFGILVVALAVSAWWTGRRELVAALGAVCILSLLVAFGRHMPFWHGLLFRYLPYFNKFRVPSMIVILPAFAAAVLSAHGACALRTGLTTTRWGRALPWVLASLGGAILLLGAAGLAEGGFQDQLRTLAAKAGKQPQPALLARAWDLHRDDLVRIGLILLTAAAALLLARRRPGLHRHGLIWVLAGLVFVDLLAVDARITHPEKSLWELAYDRSNRPQLVHASALLRPYRPSPVAEEATRMAPLAELVGHDRVWPLGRQALQNEFMWERIRSLGGYHPAKLATFEVVRQRLNAPKPAGRIASWLAGRVVSVDQELSGAQLSGLARLGADLQPQPLRAAGMVHYRNRAALPRARWLSLYTVAERPPQADDLQTFLDGIQSGEVPFASRVLLDREPSPKPDPTGQDLPAPEFLRDGLNEVVLNTRAEVPALLLLADMAAPGWRVQIDDQDAELLQADLILRAVAVPPGEHRVRFSYHDPAVRRGLTVSLLGLALVCAMLLLPGRWLPGQGRSAADTGSGAGIDA